MPRPTSAAAAGTGRIPGLDTARLLGLLLVYHGHLIERVSGLGNAAAALQHKAIQSFHMPLFFVLAGLVVKDRRESPLDFARSRLGSRVLPFLFFNLLLAVASLAAPRDFPVIPLATLHDYVAAAHSTVVKFPVFDEPTWFLMCLVSVEVLHLALFRFLRGSRLRIGAAALACYAVGWLINARFDFLGAGRSYWFWNEAVPMYAFYLAGVLLQPAWSRLRAGRAALALGAAAAFAAVLLTFQLNHGPFRFLDAVVVMAGGHGDALLFPITALAGTAGVLLLGRALPPLRLPEWLGRHGLALLGLNGVFAHHVNGPLAAWFTARVPDAGAVGVLAYGAIATALSVAATVPMIAALDRWVPQLVGRPAVDGPLLPALAARPRPGAGLEPS